MSWAFSVLYIGGSEAVSRYSIPGDPHFGSYIGIAAGRKHGTYCVKSWFGS